MPTTTTIIQRTAEEDAAYAKLIADEAILRYKEATRPRPVPKEIIMANRGIKDVKTFYKLRRKTGAQPVDRWGNVDLYLDEDFNLTIQ